MYIEAIQAGVTAAELANKLLQEKKTLLRSLKKVRFWLLKGRVRIAIFGAGGTGKSTFGQLLSGALNPDSSVPVVYKESIRTEEFKLKGDVVCTLVVPPGQRRRIPQTWPELYQSLQSGHSTGVINVCSYGYHSIQDIDWKDHKLYKHGISKDEFLKRYTDYARKMEISMLDELVPHLSTAPGKIWMLSLITKQDLWWKKRNEVRNYYETGAYNRRINKIRIKRGDQNFTHSFLSSSLVFSNFVTGSGEIIGETASGYDNAIRQANMQGMLDSVLQSVAI